MSESNHHRHSQHMTRLVRLIVLLLVTFIPSVASLHTRAQAPHRAGLVVVYGNGQVSTHCVEFSEPSISGYEVLMRAGLDIGIDASNSMGVAICRIRNDGCNYPQQPCFCQCTDLSGAVPCLYWSYWHLQGSSWQYSGMGASNHQVTHGDVEGWVWGSGIMGGGAPPPSVTFEQLCQTTHQPAEVPQSSSPPKLADDGKRLELPVITHFVADRTLIQAGESVALDWELHDADKAFLIYDDIQQGIEGEGPNSQVVLSPTRTTTYTLLASNEDGDVSKQVVVEVNPVTPTPTETSTPSPTPTFTPTATETSTSTSTPTPTPTAAQLPPTALPVVSPPASLAPTTSSSEMLASPTPILTPGLPAAQGDVVPNEAGQGAPISKPTVTPEPALARRTSTPAMLAERSGDATTTGRALVKGSSPQRQSNLLVVWLGLAVALGLGGLVIIGIVVALLLIARGGKAGRR